LLANAAVAGKSAMFASKLAPTGTVKSMSFNHSTLPSYSDDFPLYRRSSEYE